jgi:hypothetical protein
VTRRRASKERLALRPFSGDRDPTLQPLAVTPQPLAVTPHPLVLSLSKDEALADALPLMVRQAHHERGPEPLA